MPRSPDIIACLNGEKYRLRLTLGALVELEEALGADSLLALVERFEQGRFTSRDLVRLVAAGLRGAGHVVTDEEVAHMTHPDGVQGFVTLAARLLAAAFPATHAEEGASKSEHGANVHAD